jgi:hypothetical protein
VEVSGSGHGKTTVCPRTAAGWPHLPDTATSRFRADMAVASAGASADHPVRLYGTGGHLSAVVRHGDRVSAPMPGVR